jgi:hypothetical protein
MFETNSLKITLFPLLIFFLEIVVEKKLIDLTSFNKWPLMVKIVD